MKPLAKKDSRGIYKPDIKEAVKQGLKKSVKDVATAPRKLITSTGTMVRRVADTAKSNFGHFKNGLKLDFEEREAMKLKETKDKLSDPLKTEKIKKKLEKGEEI